MKNIFIVILIIFVVGLSALEIKRNIKPALTFDGPFLNIGKTSVGVEIADDYLERVQGLSDRRELGEHNGMLFVFSDKQKRSFWMKNMLIPLDIIWIDDGKVIKIYENLEPEGQNPVNKYSSVLPVNYGLEVNAGFCEEYDVKVGDSVEMFID